MSQFNPTTTVMNADGTVEQRGDYTSDPSVSLAPLASRSSPFVVGHGRDDAADLTALESSITSQIARVNADQRMDAETKAILVANFNASLAYQKARRK